MAAQGILGYTQVNTKRSELYLDSGEPRLTYRTVFTRQTPCALLVLVVAGAIPSAFALSLGGEQVSSSLGQPLRMTIPLLGSTAESLDTRCYRVVTPSRSDGLSVIVQARIELQTSTNPPQLIIRSSRSIDEPVVRISIEAGCDAPIRRDYTILLDPPSLQTAEPRVAIAAPSLAPPISAERLAPSPSAAPMSASDNAMIAAERAASARTARAAVAASAKKALPTAKGSSRDKPPTLAAARDQSRPATATAKQIQQDKLEVKGGTPTNATTPAEIASLSALAVPRLRIASDLVFLDQPGNQPGAAPVDELQAAIAKDRRARLLAAPIESDLAPRLEADLVVAQRRLAELQSQLAAAGMIAKTDSSTSPAGRPLLAAPPAVTQGGAWDWQRWVWIPGLLLVVGLIAFLLRQRRNQPTTQFATPALDTNAFAADDEITVVRTVSARNDGKRERDRSSFSDVVPLPAAAAAAAAAATTATSPAADVAPMSQYGALNVSKARQPIMATRDEREASDRLNNPLFQLRDTESHVDVTELSQVTDEAQVYADLGRNDQAIELLRDHIDAQTGDLSSPAPWLMIFELYRRTNNRQGYDELAPQFRKHFNGRVPEWDNYGHELALDDGLEAFPHLVARIERDWGTSEARKFLEELLYDNRGGSRLGFSLAAYRDILLLLQVHEGLNAQPDFLAAATDWESRGANDSDGTPKWDLSLETIEPPKSGELESFLNRPQLDKP